MLVAIQLHDNGFDKRPLWSRDDWLSWGRSYFADDKEAIGRWWCGVDSGPAPGRVVPIFGAGISIDPPTGLPGAEELTRALAHHLLHERTAEELLKIFYKHSEVLGRSIPRLEHLLSATFKVAPGAIQLLKIFDDVEPNRNHHVLARHLIEKRCWAITTNFDKCVEKAGNFSIPVHIFDLESDDVKVLYGDKGADWGLIKLHGTIAEGPEGLASTLEHLTPGLPEPTRKLLDHVLSTADIVVVAGYSATDHFDVNEFFRSKLNQPQYKADFFWLDHQPEHLAKSWFPETKGFSTLRWRFRFANVRIGPTCDLLAKILGDAPVVADPARKPHWKERLKALYAPSVVDRHRIGAALTAEMGLAILTQESVAQLCYETENDDEEMLREADSYAVEGRWWIARDILRQYRRKCKSDKCKIDVCLRLASLRRKSGHPMMALVSLMSRALRARLIERLEEEPSSAEQPPSGTLVARGSETRFPATAELQLEIAACLLDICRLTQRLGLFRTKLARAFWNWLLDKQFERIRRGFLHDLKRTARSDSGNLVMEGMFAFLRLHPLVLLCQVYLNFPNRVV
jgi:hypothetical protein